MLCMTTSGMAMAEPQSTVSSESRDASLVYVGTVNFIVNRVGSECLAVAGRDESPKQFVAAWQQRNARYVQAANTYKGMRLKEAEAKGGEKRRAALNSAMTAGPRATGSAIVQGWIEKDGKARACKRAVALVDAGGFDISPKVPMYDELEALVSWAKQ